MSLVLSFPFFFSQYYPELFPPRNTTVMRRPNPVGDPKVHVSLDAY